MREQPSLKIGLSGVRGIAGESLTPQLVTSFAAAFGTHCGRGPVVLGTDTRPSREMVTEAAVAGLLSVGCEPILLGVVPAPTLQHYVARAKALGGICVTASHNPMEWNALKFFGADGILLRPNQFTELLDLYHQGVYPRVPAAEIPDPTHESTASGAHHDRVLDCVDVDRIRERRFRVVVDGCNGASSEFTPDFLRRLNCEVIELHTQVDEPFPRDPEPTPENTTRLAELVRSEGADVGFALDADADRLGLVGDTGEHLGEDATIGIVVQHRLSTHPGPVVISMSTSRMVEDIADAFGVPVHRARVGEIHVVEAMAEFGSDLGGEGNGGVIIPSVNPCRDSFLAIAMILEGLATSGKRLSEMRAELPRYSLKKEKLPCRPRQIALAIRRLKRVYAEGDIDTTDGLRVSWPDRWLHVRGSNTEPVLRVLAEGPDEATALGMIQRTEEYLRSLLG
ncbi:MAG: phosphoglucosamine mutase [Planctomycetota bacterium]